MKSKTYEQGVQYERRRWRREFDEIMKNKEEKTDWDLIEDLLNWRYTQVYGK